MKGPVLNFVRGWLAGLALQIGCGAMLLYGCGTSSRHLSGMTAHNRRMADAVVVRELKDLCGECRIDYELVSSDTAQLEQESFELLMSVALDPKVRTKPFQCGPTIAELRQKSPGAKKVYWVVPSYFHVPAKYATQIVRLSFLGQLIAVAQRSQQPVAYVIVTVEGPVVVNKDVGLGEGVKFSCTYGFLPPNEDHVWGDYVVFGALFPYARDSPVVTELRHEENF